MNRIKGLAAIVVFSFGCHPKEPPREGIDIAVAAPNRSATSSTPVPSAPHETAPTAIDRQPTTRPCQADAECRMFSSYCADAPCGCRALGPGEGDPVCAGPKVQCLINPCQWSVARCEQGTCVVRKRETK